MSYCDVMNYTFDVGYAISPILLFIHIFKFLAANKKQSLLSKNLASYCLGTTAAYAIAWILRTRTTINYTNDISLPLTLGVFWCCLCNSAFLLFSVNLDAFLYLRRNVKNHRLQVDSRDHEKFVIYSIFSWGIPLVMFVSQFSKGLTIMTFSFSFTILIIYFVCVVLFLISLYYVRWTRADDRRVKDSNAVSNVAIRVRLILILGFTYLIWISIFIIRMYVDGDKRAMIRFEGCAEIYHYTPLLPPLEGVFIFFGFTLEKDVFKDNEFHNADSKLNSDRNKGARLDTGDTATQ